MSFRPIRHGIPLSLALALSLAGCQSPPSAVAPSDAPPDAIGKPAASFVLMGRVRLGAPVEGATLRVYSLKGELLAEHLEATNGEGCFVVPAPEGVVDFRVEAIPPSDAPAAQQGVASTEVRAFSPHHNLVYLDPVTTVVSERLRQQPSEKLESIEDKARVLFAVHPDSDLDFALDEPDLFDEAAFMVAAQANGGFKAHVAQTAASLGQPTAPAQPMQSANDAKYRLAGIEDDVIDMAKKKAKGMAMNLALSAGKSLAAKAQGTVVGWGLNSVLSLFDEEEDKTAAQLEAIQNELKAQREMLVGITSRLQGISEKIAEVKAALAQMEIRTKRQLLKSNYEQAFDGVVMNQLSTLDDLQKKLRFYTFLDPKEAKYRRQADPAKEAARRAQLALEKAELLRLQQQIAEQVPQIYQNLFNVEMGKGNVVTSAMSRWTLLAANKQGSYPTSLGEGFIQELHTQIEQMETHQVRALLLLLEAHHLTGNTSKAKFDHQDVMQQLEAQRKMAYVPDLSGVCVAPKFGRMWLAHPLQVNGKASPPSYKFNFIRQGPSFSPQSPKDIIAQANPFGLNDWYVPSVAEIGQISGLEKDGAVTEQTLNQFGIHFDKNQVSPLFWTSDAQGPAPIAYDVSRGIAYRVDSTTFSLLPVRKVPVLVDP